MPLRMVLDGAIVILASCAGQNIPRTALSVSCAQAVAMSGDRRGSVALLTGIMVPVLVMSVALGVEITSWSVGKVQLQRIADLSAWAGAMQYASLNDPQMATRVAADVAELNGVSGATVRTWSAGTLTTTDNLVTAQLVSGVHSASDNAIKVTVKRSVLKTLSGIFPSTQQSVTLSAVSYAEIMSLGPQPCIVALGGGVDGTVTGVDIGLLGNATLNATGCSVRSNDVISQSGSGSINAPGVYAGGTISGSVCCDLHANAGQIPDPYANNIALQAALALVPLGIGTAVSVKSNATQNIVPGSYSGWNVQGTLNLAPGLYLINGNFSAGAQANVTGTGVTIIVSGTVSTGGGASLALSAPTITPVGNAIPGVLIAGNSTNGMTFQGNSTAPLTGVIYFPRANLSFGGTSGGGSSGCTEVIAASITLKGASNLAANCSGYGTVPFSSLPGMASVALVR